MIGWAVSLEGDSFDLMTLSENLCSGEVTVVHKVNEYYLRAKEFDDLKSAKNVKSAAATLLAGVNGAARLHVQDFRPIRLGAVRHFNQDGTSQVFVELYGKVEARAMLTVVAMRDGVPILEPTVIPLDNTIQKAIRHPVVAKALSFFAQDHTWMGLYKVWEIVVEDVGGGKYKGGFNKVVGPNKWVDRSVYDNFSVTANTYQAIGDTARHAQLNEQVPADVTILSLDEGADFIRDLLSKWLQTK